MRNILDRFYYAGDDLGLNYRSRQSVFKVWSPTAAAFSVALYDDAGSYDASGKLNPGEEKNARLYRMDRDLSTGVWRAVIPEDLRGRYYLYRAEFPDGTVCWAADPYARAVSANGERMAVVSLEDTDPPGWDTDRLPPFSAPQDAVICELHIRDFSIDANSGMKHRGKFLAFTERETKNRDGAVTGVDHLVSSALPMSIFCPVLILVPSTNLRWMIPPRLIRNSTGVTIRKTTMCRRAPTPRIPVTPRCG